MCGITERAEAVCENDRAVVHVELEWVESRDWVREICLAAKGESGDLVTEIYLVAEGLKRISGVD